MNYKSLKSNGCKFLSGMIVLALFFLLCVTKSYAELISTVQLKKMGLDPATFQIDRFSHDKKILFGLRKIVNPVAIKKRGGGYDLVLLYLNGLNLNKVEFIPLPVRRFDNISFLEDSKTALFVSEKGANFFKIDIPNKKVAPLFKHIQGKPGFRLADPLIYVKDGAFYAFGYFYNELDETGEDTFLAKVNLNAKEPALLFEKGLGLMEVQNVIGLSTFGTYIPPDTAIWGVRRPQDGLLELKVYNNGTGKILDTGIGFTGVVCAGNRILYVVKKPGKQAKWNAIVRDLDSNLVWRLGNEDTPYTYPFLSMGGQTAVISSFNFDKKGMSFFYAKRKHDFLLQPIAALQNVDLGSFRLSPDGELFAFFNSKGLLIDQIK